MAARRTLVRLHRLPPADGTEGTETVALARPTPAVHRIGEPVDQDEQVLAFPEDDALMMFAEIDRRRPVPGGEHRGRDRDPQPALAVPDRDRDRRPQPAGTRVKVVDDPVAEFTVVASEGPRLVLQTDLDAERGRVVRSTSTQLAADGSPGLGGGDRPSGRPPCSRSIAVRDGFVAVHLADAARRSAGSTGPAATSGWSRSTAERWSRLDGEPDAAECFVGLSSVTAPTRSYRLDTATGEVTALPDLVPDEPRAASRRPRSPSSGGRRPAPTAPGCRTSWSLRPGVDRSAPQPTLLWGYGGFKIPILADYRSGWSGWLAAGGRLAIANLRGGGEFGTAWHEAGRLSRKQNVFDDFVAVAEDLTATGLTTPGQLALHGRSNGGLLVGAVLTQRPDLAAVALPAVGVLDMLRFPRFTVGAAWISDYGDPDDPDQFAVLRAYSPLHNVSAGHGVPGHPGADRRPRRPGGAAAQPQVHRRPAARAGRATRPC